MHLVLIETSSNQRYIFATNKLRENVGASELAYRVGTQWVLEAVGELAGVHLWSLDPVELRRRLLDEASNRKIEDGGAAEVVIAVSGMALLLTDTEDTARSIVSRVTERSLCEAPGLQVTGVVSPGFSWGQDPLWKVNAALHSTFEEERQSVAQPAQRFLQTPFAARCGVSGLPGAEFVRAYGGEELLSSPSAAKVHAYGAAVKRFGTAFPGADLERNVAALKKTGEDAWLGVVHADGNGIGQLVIGLAEYAGLAGAQQNREYVDLLRRFSVALDRCTLFAFERALSRVRGGAGGTERGDEDADDAAVPVVPLILGGDDLTVVCHGKVALSLAVEYLRALESFTADPSPDMGDVIPALAKAAFGLGRLGASAGVALVKSHFPFSTAYELADELTDSAKGVKRNVAVDGRPWPCCALDFHVVFDSSATDLAGIRAGLEVDGGRTRLHGRPYVVSAPGELPTGSFAGWVQHHSWDRLIEQVGSSRAEEDGCLRLPRSQVYTLREGMFLGRTQVDARLRLIYDRYEDRGLVDLVERAVDAGGHEVPSLFWSESGAPGQESPVHVTRLLDVIEAAPFLQSAGRPGPVAAEEVCDA